MGQEEETRGRRGKEILEGVERFGFMGRRLGNECRGSGARKMSSHEGVRGLWVMGQLYKREAVKWR